MGGVDNVEDRPDHPITCYGGVCVGLAAVSSIICTEHQVISLAHLCRNFCNFDPRLYLGDDSNITAQDQHHGRRDQVVQPTILTQS